MFADAESFLGAYRADWCGLHADRHTHAGNGWPHLADNGLPIRGCSMPVIIMTGHGDVGSARQAFRAQAVDFLEKPIDQARLIEAIADAHVQVGSAIREQGASSSLA
jgi:FixJ family two-component response regulator